ncbi:MAG TPA: DivIVA domain-containing protein, partial [Acidimicrobiales bacterium]
TATAMTPDEIENHVFSLVRRGFDPDEVNAFLHQVAATLSDALSRVDPPADESAEATADDSAGTPISGEDDFGHLGEEVAAILRQAHDSVAELRHRAEADAALLRQTAEQEAATVRRKADADRQAAAIELEAARNEAARVLADIARQADAAADSAAALATQRTREVIDAARLKARGGVTVQRKVRGRLEDVRDDIYHALNRLIEEDEDLFAEIDLTDATLEAAARDEADAAGPDLVPPPGQGPPTPPVPPPARSTPPLNGDLPYAADDDEIVDLVDTDGDDSAAAEPPRPDADGADADPLAQMVKNAVENALKRRKGDGGHPNWNDT